MEKTISIIIPVYNTSAYLEQCIDSIVNQELLPYEVILVNDGSTDNSGEICNQYDMMYDFIRVIHKDNGGLSDARNVGIKNASGDYILFLDSDDYIYKGSLRNIYNTLKENPNVDVIFLTAEKVFPNGKVVPLGDNYQKEFIFNQPREIVLEHIASLPKFPGSACTKLVKRNFIISNMIFFENGLFSEDIDWTLNVILKASSFNYCKDKYYYYRQDRPGSITNSNHKERFISLLYIIKKWCNYNNNFNRENKQYIEAFLSYEYMLLIYMYSMLNKSYKKIAIKDLKLYSWLLNKSKIKKLKYINLIAKLLGIKVTSYLLSLYVKIR